MLHQRTPSPWTKGLAFGVCQSHLQRLFSWELGIFWLVVSSCLCCLYSTHPLIVLIMSWSFPGANTFHFRRTAVRLPMSLLPPGPFSVWETTSSSRRVVWSLSKHGVFFAFHAWHRDRVGQCAWMMRMDVWTVSISKGVTISVSADGRRCW